MTVRWILLLLAAVVGAVPAVNERDALSGGGWGANAFNGTCPANSYGCFIAGCCPNSLSCLGTDDPDNVICCPENMSLEDCENIFMPAPACADSSWTLWNSTTQGQYGGFFCCDDTQIGDRQGSCYPSNFIASITLAQSAQQVAAQTVPSTNLASTITGFSTVSHSIPTTTGIDGCGSAFVTCLDQIAAPTCGAISCACSSFIIEYGCFTSYCASALPTELPQVISLECSGAAQQTSGSSSGGLSQPAKIGVGVGVGVGGALAAAGVIILLVKAGVFASAGTAMAGSTAGAGASGTSGAAASGAGGAPPGDMTMVGKMGFYGYTGGAEAANFSAPPPGYAPGAETAGFGGPTGGEFTSQAPMTGYGGPTGTEGANFSAPGPTGTEGANLTAPGTTLGPTGTEAANFSAPGPTGTEGANFSAPGTTAGPTGAESANFNAPGNPSMGISGLDGASFGAQPPPAGAPPNATYFAAPAAVAPLAAGAAFLGRRKPVGSSPASPPGGTSPQNQASEYMAPNLQHELRGDGVYHGSELGSSTQ